MIEVTKVMLVSMLSNIILSIAKIIIGYFYRSNALIADGINSLSDLLTDFIALFGIKIANKPANGEHPYGHGNAEYVTSLIIGFVLILLGLYIIYTSNNTNQEASFVIIVVSSIAILVKYLVASYLTKKGQEYDDNILMTNGRESKLNVITSIIVLVSAILMQFQKQVPILGYADQVATIIVSLFITFTGYNILRENISVLLGKQDNNLTFRRQVIDTILQNTEVKNIDNLVLMKYGKYYSVTLAISVNPLMTIDEASEVMRDLKKELKKLNNKVSYITININPYKKA